MSYLYDQKIKDKVYVYKVTGYWDKEKQQARQKRICLGRRDLKTKNIIPSKSQQPPRACRDYGNYYVLKTIAERLGLATILRQIFPCIWSEILTCAFYEVSERKPLYLCEQWTESTQTINNTILTSQKISDLLRILGKADNDRMDFFQAWATHRSEHEYLAFDITSISSYSKIIEFIEFGYNRDGEELPQINLAMLFGQTSLLPIFYNSYPGSIKDMSTLKNMIHYAKNINLRRIHFVMDKGFYSDDNVAEMLENRVKFVISVPFTTEFAKSAVDLACKTIAIPSNFFTINGDIIYACKQIIKRKNKRLNVFVCYSERKLLDAKESLLKKILLLEITIGTKRSLSNFHNEYLKYVHIRKTKNGYKIKRNEQEIEKALKYKGYVVIISNDIKQAQEALHLYRAKDVVERAFDNFKNELDLKRLRVHSDLAMTGRLFIGFISLILHSQINKRMKEIDLYKIFTQEEVMQELKKIKIIEFHSQNKIITEISKKQNSIFKSLNIPVPSAAALL